MSRVGLVLSHTSVALFPTRNFSSIALHPIHDKMQLPKPIFVLALLCQLVAIVESLDTEIEYMCGRSYIVLKKEDIQISMERVARKSYKYLNKCCKIKSIMDCSLEGVIVNKYKGPGFTASSGSTLLKTPVKVHDSETDKIGTTWVVLSCNTLTCKFQGVVRKPFIRMKYMNCNQISHAITDPGEPSPYEFFAPSVSVGGRCKDIKHQTTNRPK
ncbi:BgTH12-03061 [Blumeria graminis f. sp. triticale]|nr:BgTH12-03058 [Blumeria graminis f. sp. triticale]CAD6503394.1 BgTH12-03059 [Blumeria graminis f. sp. triticale]CAD6503395.1 BgTH12-03060 [Blumeria graminis f. sp. triticale]CAD6503396.1 BgTH12-03061 [Blumeria graminis f. sp. triticale]